MKGITAIIVFNLLFICSYSQNTSYAPLVLYQVSEQNGLSDNHVQCVLKDHNGLLWVGTSDGLNLLDGAGITIFKHHIKDSTSIAGNTINSIQEDKAGIIWIATTAGLCNYDPERKVFSLYTPPAGAYGNSNVIKSMVIDSSENIWCGTSGGLYKFEIKSKSFSSYYIPGTDNNTHSNRINHLFLDSKNKLWLCTYDGIWSFNVKSAKFKTEINKENDHNYEGLFLWITEDHNGNLWTGGWDKGLKLLERNTGKVTSYSLLTNDPHQVSFIAEVQQTDGTYVLWINGPLLAFNPLQQSFFQYPKPLQLTDYPNITASYTSPDKWQWMMSDFGLFIYNPQRQVFHHKVIKRLVSSQGLAVKSWNNGLLAGGEGDALLTSFDNNWTEQNNYKFVANQAPAFSPGHQLTTLCIHPVNDKYIWLGTSEGIAHIDAGNRTTRWYRHETTDSSLPRNFIPCLLQDSKGELWVFPWREGIWKMHGDGKFYRIFEGFNNEGTQKKKLLVADAVEDAGGNLWMADLDEGIILFDRKKNQFLKPFSNYLTGHINSNRIYFRNGFYYSIAERTLIKWTNDLGAFIQYHLPEEMDKEVYDFALDESGRWWIATKNGLIVFDESIQNFQRFTIADGLVNNDMNGSLYFNKDNGNIIFIHSQAISTFKPSELLQAIRTVPGTLLTGIAINGKPVSKGNLQLLNLDYQSNNLQFRWALPDYTNPFNNQYYYKLDKIDKDWNLSVTKGEIQYANLSPGKYTLFLQGANSNGIKSQNILTIPFTIFPPFWKTWWFLALIIAVVAVLVYYWYRYRVQQALKLERIRTKISTDLHDDIGSTLSSISILSDMALKDGVSLQSAGMISEIKENSLSLMEKMDDIVWSINPMNDSLENLLMRTKKFAIRLFEARLIDYRIEIGENIKSVYLPMEFRQHIYLILKEAINNLVKYAEASNAEITADYNNHLLLVTIKDNGKGFEPAPIPGGNGLLNMKSRATIMQGTLKIASNPGAGTVITLQVKIK